MCLFTNLSLFSPPPASEKDCFFFLFWPYLQHMEPGIESELQLWQCRILNALCHSGNSWKRCMSLTFYFFLDSTCKWYYAVFVFSWLISLSIMHSKVIHAVANDNISCLFFFFFSLFRATHLAYGNSQARGRIGAVAAGHNHSFFMIRRPPRSTPQLTSMPNL